MTDAFTNDQDHMIDETKNYLEELVGEGKKFKTPEELARGKAEADAFITKLTGELDNLRTEVQKRKTVEEVADMLRNRENSGSSNQDNQDDEHGSDSQNSAFSREDVEKLLERKLAESQKMTVAQSNLKEVNSTLSAKLGSSASMFIRQKADELGVTVDYLEGQAKENPKVFYRLIDLDRQGQPIRNTLPNSSVNTSASLGNERDRTYSYYRDMFKKTPSLEWDPKINVQMHKDAQRLGEKFFDTE